MAYCRKQASEEYEALVAEFSDDPMIRHCDHLYQIGTVTLECILITMVRVLATQSKDRLQICKQLMSLGSIPPIVLPAGTKLVCPTKEHASV